MAYCIKCGLVVGYCLCSSGSTSNSFVSDRVNVLDRRFDPIEPVYEDIRRRTCNPVFMTRDVRPMIPLCNPMVPKALGGSM